MSRVSDDSSDTIVMGKGMTMTFLRDEQYLARVHVSGESDADTLTVPPHWHEFHDEAFRVISGSLEVTIGGNTKVYGPEDGEVFIPRRTSHSMKSIKGVEVIFEERTDPMDESKELFFRNVYKDGKMLSNPLAVVQAFYSGDSYFALPGSFRAFEKGITALFGVYLASLFGCKLRFDSLKRT